MAEALPSVFELSKAELAALFDPNIDSADAFGEGVLSAAAAHIRAADLHVAVERRSIKGGQRSWFALSSRGAVLVWATTEGGRALAFNVVESLRRIANAAGIIESAGTDTDLDAELLRLPLRVVDLVGEADPSADAEAVVAAVGAVEFRVRVAITPLFKGGTASVVQWIENDAGERWLLPAVGPSDGVARAVSRVPQELLWFVLADAIRASGWLVWSDLEVAG